MKYSYILGAPKSGTTSLARALGSCGINIPHRKEIMYFDVNYKKGIDWYNRHANDTILFDGTPTYLSNLSALARIIQFSNTHECSFVVILRNPIDRYWSHVNDLISWGALSELEVKNDPFVKCYLRRGKGTLEMSPYMYSCYEASLRYLNRCGVDYLLVDFDNLHDPSTLGKIANELLDLDKISDNQLERHHSSFEWRSKNFARLLNSEFSRSIFEAIPNRNVKNITKKIYYVLQKINYDKKIHKFYDKNVNEIVKESLQMQNANLNSEIFNNERRIGSFKWLKQFM